MTHLDVDDAALDRAVEIVADVLEEVEANSAAKREGASGTEAGS